VCLHFTLACQSVNARVFRDRDWSLPIFRDGPSCRSARQVSGQNSSGGKNESEERCHGSSDRLAHEDQLGLFTVPRLGAPVEP
jgi:hypothetical protein